MKKKIYLFINDIILYDNSVSTLLPSFRISLIAIGRADIYFVLP